VDIHVRRHAHAVELLLPIAGGDLVVDERDEAEAHRLPPADDDLPVNQAVVDPIPFNAHRECRRRVWSLSRGPPR
jgi:hypothetical protein